MHEQALEEAAGLLAAYRTKPEPFDRFPPHLVPATEADAYAIQARLARLREPGRAIAGYKIGCTTAVMQAFLSIDRPCAGILAADAIHRSPADVVHGAFRRIGVECEIAVRLGRDLPPGGVPYDRTTVEPAIAAAMAAIELVDDRYVDYPGLDAWTLTADDFFHAGAILGPAVTAVPDLAAVTGCMTIGGTVVGTGTGAHVLGHPFNAVAWLANTIARHGEGLKSGQVILTGSVVETKWPLAGDTVVASLHGLGDAEVRFL
ncbi:MAG: fumarylacetoacetate hydrolase family protein [Rhodospirillaceae bacterium]|nr:fumarylacetoacetate hydrolase family protein [Rhodospirillaceae bacterium]